MRELHSMVLARLRTDWDHTAALLATIHNIARGKDQRAATVIDKHPYRDPEPQAAAVVTRKLKRIFDGNGRFD